MGSPGNGLLSSCSAKGPLVAQRYREITALRNQLATLWQSEIKVVGQKKRPCYQTVSHDRHYMPATNFPARNDRHGILQSPVKKNGTRWGCPMCRDIAGAPADATHDTLSHFMIIWVASLTALILKDYPSSGHYAEHRLAPSSLLLHWIILASSSVISLEHHLCMLFLGYYLQESKYYG